MARASIGDSVTNLSDAISSALVSDECAGTRYLPPQHDDLECRSCE